MNSIEGIILDINKRASYNLITFIISKFISNLGSSTYSFGISLYVLSITGSATNFAINFLCSSLPRILLAPISGYIADKYSKRIIVLFSQTMSIIIVFSLLLLSMSGAFSILAIYITTTLLAITSLFNSVAFSSSIMCIVDKERIQKALSLQKTSTSLASIIGPILGGILYASFELNLFLIIFLVCYTIAVILESTIHFTLFIQQQTNKGNIVHKSMFKEISKGFVYLKSTDLIFSLVSISIIVSFFFTSIQVGMPYIMVNLLNLSSYKYGMIQSSFAIGMILTSIYLSFQKEFLYPFVTAKKALLFTTSLFALIVLPMYFSLSQSILLTYYIIWALMLGGSLILMNTPIEVKLVKLIEEEYRGRVIGLVDTFSSALMPVGIILYGYLFDTVGAKTVMLSTSFISFFSVIYLLRKSILLKAHPDYSSQKVNAKNGRKTRVLGG
ncbi:hypothetical protein BK734_23080 [Bacillus thuringiensis serovar kim]|nr:hypothetical protein BK734_23080 [Bacillus thuringiensis serovar kim]